MARLLSKPGRLIFFDSTTLASFGNFPKSVDIERSIGRGCSNDSRSVSVSRAATLSSRSPLPTIYPGSRVSVKFSKLELRKQESTNRVATAFSLRDRAEGFQSIGINSEHVTLLSFCGAASQYAYAKANLLQVVYVASNKLRNLFRDTRNTYRYTISA